MRRSHAWSLGATAVVALLLAASLPAPWVTGAIAWHAQTLDVSVTGGRAGFSVLRGARLDDVLLTATSADVRLRATVDSLRAPHEWSLTRPLVIRRLQLRGAEVRIVLGRRERDAAADASLAGSSSDDADPGAAPETERPPGSEEERWLAFVDPSVELDDSVLTVHQAEDDEPILRARALTLRLAAFGRGDPGHPVARALTAGGGFVADTVELDEVRLRGVTGRVDVADGQVRLSDVTFTCGRSELRLSEATVDLTGPEAGTMRAGALAERPAGSGDDWQAVTPGLRLATRCLR